MATRDDYSDHYNHPFYRVRAENATVAIQSGYKSRSDLYPWINSDSTVFTTHAGQYRRTHDYTSSIYRFQRDVVNAGRKRMGMTPFDIGNPFWSERIELTRPTFEQPPDRLGASNSYRLPIGPLYPDVDTFNYAQSFAKTAPGSCDNEGVAFGDMVTYGSAGIKRAMPGVPPISMFQILGELREGLPRIPGSTLFDWKLVSHTLRKDPSRIKHLFSKGSPARKGTSKLSASGSEYLNVMFGILPGAQSVIDLIDISQNYPALAKQFYNNANLSTRRHRVLRDFDTEDITVLDRFPFPQADVYQPVGKLETRTNTHLKVWVDSSWSPRPAYTALASWLSGMPSWVTTLGLLPNAANLWELIPFSWLVDYFTNAGVVLSNLSYMGVTGLGMDYAYAMATKTTTTRWTWTGPYLGKPIRTAMTRYVETHQRIRATPFGFGLNPASLTGSQLAILTALGISRRSLARP